MDSNVPWPSAEFGVLFVFDIMFRDVYSDLEKLFPGETHIPDMSEINELRSFTRVAVLMLRESILRKCSIYEAASGMNMDLSDWNDWTVTYATDFFMQLNNPVIYL